MKTRQLFLLGAVALGAMLQVAKADEWDQKTVFTFSVPVEIPGQVLVPGTYVFKLADSPSDRNIVQVFNKDENRLYGTFFAIPDFRLEPSDKPVITFEERPVGTPEAVKAWFYPGENYGHDFVYPKPKAVVVAEANETPAPLVLQEPPAAPAIEEPQIAIEAPPLAVQPQIEEEVEIAELAIVEGTPLPEELPQTASNLPMIGLVGLLCLAGGLGLTLVSSENRGRVEGNR